LRTYFGLYIICYKTTDSNGDIVQSFSFEYAVYGRQVVNIVLVNFDICFFKQLACGAFSKRFSIF
jgi:hypothetical protein